MRILFILTVILTFSAPAWAVTPVLIASQSAGSADSLTVTTSAMDSTGANFCWASFVELTIAGAFSDSKANSWTEKTKYTSTTVATFSIRTFYVANPTVGSGHTVTVSGGGSAGFYTVNFRCYSGVANAPFDTQNGGTSALSQTSYQVPSVSPSATTNLCIVSMTNAYAAPTGVSINSSFTDESAVTESAGNHFAFYTANKITVGATESPTISWTGAGEATAQDSCFTNLSSSVPRGTLMGVLP